MKEKVKWGVIGSAGIAQRKTIPEGIIKSEYAELAAVYDLNQEANNKIAKHYSTQALNSLDELLDTDIDAVYIASPAYLHYEQAICCAKSKKHVLCEKPLGLTVKEAKEMLSAFKKQGVMLGTALMMRFHAQHQSALKMIKEGKIGRPVYARTQLSCWYPPMKNAWRQDPKKGGGGALIDMGGHCIDLLEMFFGRIEKVSCFVNNSVHDYKSEDSAVAIFTFENGAISTVDTFFCIPDDSSKNRLELYGSKGSIIAEGTIGQGETGKMTAFFGAHSSGYDAQQNRDILSGIEILPPAINMYRAEIDEFSRAILENCEPLNNAEIGLRSQKILGACYESARLGKTVRIDC